MPVSPWINKHCDGRSVMSCLHVGTTACNTISGFHCSRIWRPSGMQISPDPIHWFPKLLPCLKQSPHNYSCFGIHHGISLRQATASNSEAVRAPDVLKLGWGSSESNTDHVSKFTCMCYGSQLTTIKTLVSVWTLKKVIDCSSRKRMGQLVLTPSHIQKRFNKITAPNWTPTSKVRRVYDADPLVL